MSDNLFQKIPKNLSKIFKNLFNNIKIEKTIILVPKLVWNHYINENLAKFTHKTPKNVQFSLKALNFSQFSAPSAPKIWSFMSQ